MFEIATAAEASGCGFTGRKELLFWQVFVIVGNADLLCWVDGILTILVAERFFELPDRVIPFGWRSEYVVSGLFYRGGRWKVGILMKRKLVGRDFKADGKVAVAFKVRVP